MATARSTSLPPASRLKQCEAHGLQYDPARYDGCVICRRGERGSGAPGSGGGETSLVSWLVMGVLLIALVGAGIYAYPRIFGPDVDGARIAFQKAVDAARTKNAGQFLPLLSRAAQPALSEDASRETAMVIVAGMQGAELTMDADVAVFTRQVPQPDGTMQAQRITMVPEDGTWKLGPIHGVVSAEVKGGEVPEGAASDLPEPLPEFEEPKATIAGEAEITWEGTALTFPLNTEGDTDLSDPKNATLSYELPSGPADALVLQLDLTRRGRWLATAENDLLLRRIGGQPAKPSRRCVVDVASVLGSRGGNAKGKIGPCIVSVPDTNPPREVSVTGRFRVVVVPPQGPSLEDQPESAQEIIDGLDQEDTEVSGDDFEDIEADEGPVEPVVLGWPKGADTFRRAAAATPMVVVYFCSSTGSCADYEATVLADNAVRVQLAPLPKVEIDPDGTVADREVKYSVSTTVPSPSVWLVRKGQRAVQIQGATPEEFLDAFQAELKH